MMHLAVPVFDCFGAGTCGKYLVREFSKRKGAYLYDMMEEQQPKADVDGPLLQFAGPNLEQQTKYRGKPNIGYVFSEWEPLTEQQKENLKAFDVLIAGSMWNAKVLIGEGFKCDAVPQGVDRKVFRPIGRTYLKDRFVIYSGGKWEHRKAQDLVIRAVRKLHEKHPNITLMASWFNIWANDDHYEEVMKDGIELVGLPLLDHKALAWHMNQTDVGLFPNRCEGGTNLVMMEYMACGKPVIANTSTGQKDVLGESYSIGIEGDDDALVEKMVEGVDALKSDRQRLYYMGHYADLAMNDWPWSRTAEGIERAIDAALQ